MSAFASQGPLSKLCTISKGACDIMAPMVLSFYSAINGETAKLKADKSVFTVLLDILKTMTAEFL